MVPSPKITREVTKICFNNCIESGLDRLTKNKIVNGSRYRDIQTVSTVQDLINCSIENRTIVSSTLLELITESINSKNEKISWLAEEFCDGLSFPMASFRREKLMEDHRDFWEKTRNNLYKACSYRIEERMGNRIESCYTAYHFDKTSLDDLTKMHGLEALFQTRKNIIFNIERYSLVESILVSVIRLEYWELKKEDIQRILKDLKKLSSKFIATKPPWIIRDNVSKIPNRWTYFIRAPLKQEKKTDIKNIKIDNDMIFTIFCIISSFLELEEDVSQLKRRLFVFAKHFKHDVFPFEPLKLCILAGFKKTNDKVYLDAFKSIGFSQLQKNFILGWIKKDYFLVKPSIREVI